MSERERVEHETIQWLRSVETCTHGLEFMPEERLEKLPNDVAAHIEELEDLLSRLSLEATAVLFHLGHLPFIARGQK
jgi:hypothetical protein